MGRLTKVYLLIGPTLCNLVFEATSPTIQIYFMRLVSPEILALANMLCVGLAAVVNATIPNDRMKSLYKRNFRLIVIMDIVCFAVVSALSVEYVVVRFLGIAVLSAVSNTLWVAIMKNAINNVISGDTLTDWSSFSSSFVLFASLAGGAFAFYFTDLPVECCIAAQCIVNLVMGCTDLKAFHMLLNEREKKETDAQ